MTIKRPIYEILQPSPDAFDIVNVWVDGTKMIVRTLSEVLESEAVKAESIGTEDDLKTVDAIQPHEFIQQYRFYFKIGESYYKLVTEQPLDTVSETNDTNNNAKRIYEGGSAIIFGVKRFEKFGLSPYSVTPFDLRAITSRKFRDAEFLKVTSIDPICAVYCRDSAVELSDQVFEIFRSPDSILITNLEPTATETIGQTEPKFGYGQYHASEEQFEISLPDGMTKIPADSEVELTITAKCFEPDAPRYASKLDSAITDTEYNGTVYIGSNGGYIPTRFVRFKDGVATVRFYSDRMKSGDRLRFHVETKNNQYALNPLWVEVE